MTKRITIIAEAGVNYNGDITDVSPLKEGKILTGMRDGRNWKPSVTAIAA